MPLSDLDCASSYKVLILGDASVGKTAILRCLLGHEFQEKIRPTVAVDFIQKTFEVDGALVKLSVWDTMGDERFMSMTRQQYRGVKGIAIVYDISDRRTFTHLSFWLETINNGVVHSKCKYETVPIILIGNKVDLEDKRMVTEAEARKFSEKEMMFEFFETSAKSGTNIYNAFQRLAYHVTEICDPELMKSFHPHMLRPPEVLAKRRKSKNENGKVKSKSKVFMDEVIYIPEIKHPVGKLKYSSRSASYKFSVRRKRKAKCKCCIVS